MMKTCPQNSYQFMDAPSQNVSLTIMCIVHHVLKNEIISIHFLIPFLFLSKRILKLRIFVFSFLLALSLSSLSTQRWAFVSLILIDIEHAHSKLILFTF